MRAPVYDPRKVYLKDTGITGLRIDRAHGKNSLVKPRIYEVKDGKEQMMGSGLLFKPR